MIYINRCFDIARIGIGATSPNPSVGSVIVSNNMIIGEGWTQKPGLGHAEVQAFVSIEKENEVLLERSTIFVSLEPCFHYGRTAPCVNLILEKKISNIVIAFIDPNPKVKGRSVHKLKAENKNVYLLDYKTARKENTYMLHLQTLNCFFTNIIHKRPHIILKWAESADEYISIDNERTEISNNLSKRLVHKWRSEVDGIMVGTNTALVDNPSLNNRYYFGKSPVRIILDRQGILPQNLSVFDNEHKTIIFTENKKKYENLIDNDNCDVVEIDFNTNSIDTILSYLFSQNIATLLVEGGAKLLNSFIELNLWDEARVIKSAIVLRGGIQSPNLPKQLLKSSEQIDDNTVDFYFNDLEADLE
jgi:diaminohydroxyphosphoribosylaminopyrimidine deaminase / 5-amino-6-(5-phosphoribosylamino)uracil reductase